MGHSILKQSQAQLQEMLFEDMEKDFPPLGQTVERYERQWVFGALICSICAVADGFLMYMFYW